jgi:NitT/TauT family transport system ATP-binding protein
MALLQVDKVSKRLVVKGNPFVILDSISFEIKERDFICIVGPSGSGKSTLLRIISGLEQPTSGEVRFAEMNRKLVVSMVFQSFALLPWLTVVENVAIGLEARNMPKRERTDIAKKYIDIVGLSGFEDAYPKELSGGMKQRVGIARSLAVEPDLLCMDEPFSALDVLTAQGLRDEVITLWQNNELPPSAVLMVTHNLEEAVYMADRILVISPRPGKIIGELTVDMPRPRDRKSPEFLDWVDQVFSKIV